VRFRRARAILIFFSALLTHLLKPPLKLEQEQISEMSGGMPMVPIMVLDQLRVRTWVQNGRQWMLVVPFLFSCNFGIFSHHPTERLRIPAHKAPGPSWRKSHFPYRACPAR
jgi:hypothetical protein